MFPSLRSLLVPATLLAAVACTGDDPSLGDGTDPGGKGDVIAGDELVVVQNLCRTCPSASRPCAPSSA
jgi:hypothetical protein